MRSFVLASLFLAGAALAQPAKQPTATAAPAKGPIAAPGKTKLTWYGHAAFRIDTPSGKVILIDPWIENPSNPNGKADVAGLSQVDLILVTHGHFDHIGNAVEIARKTKAKLVATFDLGNAIVGTMGYPKDQYGFDTGGNFGGTIEVLGGEVAITFVPAVHSSAIGTDPMKTQYGGNPGGFVIAIKGGPTIYHTGDTDVFGDMANIAKYAKVDVMLACIGDHFTMGPDRAAEAVRLVHPKQVVPMHFGTFPVLTGTPEAFGKALKKAGVGAKLVDMKVDSSITL